MLPSEYGKQHKTHCERFDNIPGCFQIHNVLTTEECERAITFAENLGFDNATHPDYQDRWTDAKELKYRRNDRCVYKATPEEEDYLFAAIKPHCPQEVTEPGRGTWKLWGVNDMFRVYKYTNKQCFPVHKDNSTAKTRGLMSWMSVLVYLSEGFAGGGTAFTDSPYEQPHTVIKPLQGTVLCFFHTGKQSPWHMGLPNESVEKVKYVLRTDVMYESTAATPPSIALSPPFDEKLYVYPKNKPPPPQWYQEEFQHGFVEEDDSGEE